MDLSQARVLVIDDNPAARKIARSVLEGLVQGLFEADGGLNGLKAWTRLQPELVLLDFEMPKISGEVVARYIREQEKGTGRRTAILMMTAHGDAAHVTAARRADVDGLVGKPLTVGGILGKATDALVRAREANKG